MAVTPKFDYTKFNKYKMMDVIRPVGNLFCKTYYKVEFEGLENCLDGIEIGFSNLKNMVEML